jgi:CheY-like chemotaxis protein
MPRVLVIDDSASALQTVEMILADAGYEVVTCTGGKSAVQMLRREAFDLIVTDIYMPERDGLEVIRESRRICPNVPVVAMSGVTGKRSMLAAARHLGACQTVLKPCSKASLLDAVAAALGLASLGYSVRGASLKTPPCRDTGFRK